MSDWLQGLEDDAQYDPELYGGGYDEDEPEPAEYEDEPEQPKTTRLADGQCSTSAGWYMGPYGGVKVKQHSREAAAALKLTKEPERGTTLHNDGDDIRGTLARISPQEAQRLGLEDEHVAVVTWEYTDPTKRGYEARHLTENQVADLEKAFDVQAPAPRPAPGRTPPPRPSPGRGRPQAPLAHNPTAQPAARAAAARPAQAPPAKATAAASRAPAAPQRPNPVKAYRQARAAARQSRAAASRTE